MRFLARTLLITTATLAAAAAQAGVIDWNFSYTAGGVTTNATLVTSSTLDAAGGYDILGITGKRGSQSITGLLGENPNFNDNILFASGPVADQYGIGFMVGWQAYDFYYNSTSGCGPLGYREDNGSAYPYCAYSAPSATNVRLTRTSSLPEPSTLVLMALGLGLVLAGRALSPRRVRA